MTLDASVSELNISLNSPGVTYSTKLQFYKTDELFSNTLQEEGYHWIVNLAI